MKEAAFFSISEKELYEKLKSQLPELFPARKFAFLEDTFKVEPWRPPGGKQNLSPTSRLLWKWIPMNQKAPQVADALKKYDCVIAFKFGREAYHYAIRHEDCTETLHFHKALVGMRVVEQGIYPPEYILLRPDDPRFQRADDEYFDDPGQTRHYLTAPDFHGQLDQTVSIIRQKLCSETCRKKVNA